LALPRRARLGQVSQQAQSPSLSIPVDVGSDHVHGVKIDVPAPRSQERSSLFTRRHPVSP
jgi:hypothetical protein